jgi:hypothetical protein
MRRTVELGVSVYASDGERQGELVHGTGYHDRTGQWPKGSRWIRRYPDAKVCNGMSRHALRARDAFHALREMPSARRYEYAHTGDGPFAEFVAVAITQQDAQAQAVTVLTRLLHWMGAA